MADREGEDIYDLLKPLPPMSRAQEHEIFTRRRSASETERRAIDERVVRANLAFASGVAREWAGAGKGPFGSLRRAAVRGMFTAACRFNPDLGTKFISYAVWWMRQSMYFEIGLMKEIVHVPYDVRRHIREYLSAATANPSMGEDDVFASIGMSGVAGGEVRAALAGVVHLDKGAYHEESDKTIGDVFVNTPAEADGDNHIMALDDPEGTVARAMSQLSERERFILRRYYGLGGSECQTLEEIAKSLRVTRERVRQIKDKALAKLREPLAPYVEEVEVNAN